MVWSCVCVSRMWLRLGKGMQRERRIEGRILPILGSTQRWLLFYYSRADDLPCFAWEIFYINIIMNNISPYMSYQACQAKLINVFSIISWSLYFWMYYCFKLKIWTNLTLRPWRALRHSWRNAGGYNRKGPKWASWNGENN